MRHIIAFSPGFIHRSTATYKQSIFISQASRFGSANRAKRPFDRLELKIEGYRVDYREFDGGHIIPAAILNAALARLVS
jgi:phospholipase/carboxylesterase